MPAQGFIDYRLFTDVSPFWEAQEGQNVPLEKAPTPRVIKTHAPLSLLPSLKDPAVKHIYVFRDPRDVIVSFYEHTLLTQHLQFDQSFDVFFQKFLTG